MVPRWWAAEHEKLVSNEFVGSFRSENEDEYEFVGLLCFSSHA